MGNPALMFGRHGEYMYQEAKIQPTSVRIAQCSPPATPRIGPKAEHLLFHLLGRPTDFARPSDGVKPLSPKLHISTRITRRVTLL
jgi:hypothetical protein